MVLPIGEETINESVKLIKEHGLLPNDALILATAKVFGCSLLTLDKTLAETALKLGVRVP